MSSKRQRSNKESRLCVGPTVRMNGARFNLAEWKRSRKLTIILPLGVILVLFLIAEMDSEFSAENITLVAPFIVGFFGALGAILFFYTYAMYRRSKICSREVIIGPHGLLYGGFYNTWEAIGTRLGGVKLISGDVPMLEFDIQVWGRYGSNSRPLRIPVPQGREQEAEEIIAKLAKI